MASGVIDSNVILVGSSAGVYSLLACQVVSIVLVSV